jgi:hypothetical protein
MSYVMWNLNTFGSVPCRGAVSCVSLTLWAVTIPIIIAVGLWPSSAATQEIAVPGQTPLADTQEIELIYTGNQSAPKVIVRGPQPANSFVSSSYRPSDPLLNLLSPAGAGQPVGSCRAKHERSAPPLLVRFDHTGTSPCGFVWSLQHTNKTLDALSFQTLRIRGSTSSPLTIELVDDAAGQPHSAVVVGGVAGRFDVEISLAPIARTIDLRRLTQVKLLVEGTAEVVLEECVLLNPEPTILPIPSVGFWYWDYRSAIRDPDGMLAACRQHHCRRLLLQLPDLRDSDEIWAAYAKLFALAKAVGIELFALDGAPDMIDHPTVLTDKLARLLAALGSGGLPGMQLDIEPYLLDGFPDDDTIFDRYLATIKRVKAALYGQGRLSVVIPFWFTSTIHQHRPIAFAVMDEADEVAVMSYRTDVEELVTISEDTLRYGVLARVPVWLAMETTRLLPERHVLLKRERNPSLADGILDPMRRMLTLGRPPQADRQEKDGMWFRIHHHATVRPERLSFSDRSRREVRQAIHHVFSRIRTPSFSGLLIHDLPGYRGLQE